MAAAKTPYKSFYDVMKEHVGDAPTKTARADRHDNQQRKGVLPSVRRGVYFRCSDFYNWLMATSPVVLALSLILIWVTVALIFTGLYMTMPLGALGAEGFEVTGIWDLFYISACVLAGVEIGPRAHTLGARLVYMMQGLVSLVWTALVIGIIVDRVSRPNPRVEFSKFLTIANMDGKLCLEGRIVNLRNSGIHEAELEMTFSMAYKTPEGRVGYRGKPMKPVRASQSSFGLLWNVYHIIDHTSPLYGLTAEELARNMGSITFSLRGVDEAQEKAVRVSHSWRLAQLNFGGTFKDMLSFHDHCELSVCEQMSSSNPCSVCQRGTNALSRTVAALNIENLEEIEGGDWEWEHAILPSFCYGCNVDVEEEEESKREGGAYLRAPLLGAATPAGSTSVNTS